MEIRSLVPIICDYLNLNDAINVYNAYMMIIERSRVSKTAKKAIELFEKVYNIAKIMYLDISDYYFVGSRTILVIDDQDKHLHRLFKKRHVKSIVSDEKVIFYKSAYPNHMITYERENFRKLGDGYIYDWISPYFKVFILLPGTMTYLDFVDFEKGERRVHSTFLLENEFFNSVPIYMNGELYDPAKNIIGVVYHIFFDVNKVKNTGGIPIPESFTIKNTMLCV